jgi:hypothetical protein
MTLGTGIFASTVLVLIALAVWRISVAQKWRTVGKVFGSLIVVGVLVVGAIYGYGVYSGGPKPLDGIDGLKLGMSQLDVQLLRGVPADKDEVSKNGETMTGWLYKNNAGEPDYVARFDKTGLSIICSISKYSIELGISYGDSEDVVIKKLGAPSNISIDKDGLRRLLSFSKYRAGFDFEKGKVVEMCATSSGTVRFTEEYSETAATPDAAKK